MKSPRTVIRQQLLHDSVRDRTPANLPQSASTIHLHCGRLLNENLSKADSFYALSEIFAFIAASECQLLGMMREKILPEMGMTLDQNKTVELMHSSTLSNLLYSKTILDEHILRLKENVRSIRRHGGSGWRKCTEADHKRRVEVVKDTLLEDFESLLEQALMLSNYCDRGINIAGNTAMVAESKVAIGQARWVSKLTLLAFFFIPASFTTSIFGMNFSQFGQGNLGIWIWIVVLAPVYVVSLFILFFDWIRRLPTTFRHVGIWGSS
jgi:Mg2+ and Co2+ transporter CorA